MKAEEHHSVRAVFASTAGGFVVAATGVTTAPPAGARGTPARNPAEKAGTGATASGKRAPDTF